jgi:hypothetical protein
VDVNEPERVDMLALVGKNCLFIVTNYEHEVMGRTGPTNIVHFDVFVDGMLFENCRKYGHLATKLGESLPADGVLPVGIAAKPVSLKHTSGIHYVSINRVDRETRDRLQADYQRYLQQLSASSQSQPQPTQPFAQSQPAQSQPQSGQQFPF